MMNTLQFLQDVLNWLLADPSHIVVAASAVAAVTPTPDPSSTAGKLYKVIDTFALNVLHAKSTGITPAQAATQIAYLMTQAQQAKQPAVQSPKE
jgi:hypothetical protein